MMQLRQNGAMDQCEKGLHRTKQLYLQALTHTEGASILLETRNLLKRKDLS